MDNKTLVAQWVAVRGGRGYVNLYRDKWGYCYTAENAGGSMGRVSLENAIRQVEERVIPGDGRQFKRAFLPIVPNPNA